MDFQNNVQSVPVTKPRRTWSFVVLVCMVAIVVIATFRVVGRAPADFVPGTVVTVPARASIHDAGEILESQNIIRFASIFEFITTIVFMDRPVIAGDFQFDEPVNVFQVAKRMTGGVFGNAQIKITIPEGSSNAEIAGILEQKISAWNVDEFIALAKTHEGMLFPETYFVFKKITPTEMIDRMRDEYEKQVAPLRPAIKKFGKSEREVIIMASLLEKEAKNDTEAKMIAGVLWKRIKNKQPLQVDAPFLYLLNKTSAQLKMSDLQKDGPYNTYTRTGLPAGPIGNPGIAMIRAAIEPTTSAYNFYLHGDDGQIYFAKTYAEHLENKRKYIK